MFDAAVDGSFKAFVHRRGDRPVRPQHAMSSWRRAMVARVRHRPGPSSTKPRACPRLPRRLLLERRTAVFHQCRAPFRACAASCRRAPAMPTGDHQRLAQALGYPMNYRHPGEIMTRSLRSRPPSPGVSYAKLRPPGSDPVLRATPSIRTACRPCTSTPSCAAWPFMLTPYVPTSESANVRFRCCSPPTHPVAVQRGAQTRASANVLWHGEDVLEGIRTTPRRGIRDGDWVGVGEPRRHHLRIARAAERAHARRGLHHLPLPRLRRQRGHHGKFRLGHQPPRVQGHGGAGHARSSPRTGSSATRSSRAGSRLCSTQRAQRDGLRPCCRSAPLRPASRWWCAVTRWRRARRSSAMALPRRCGGVVL